MAVDDDDELTRREMLALTGLGAFAVGAATAESDEAAEMLPNGGDTDLDTSNYLTIPPASTITIGGNERRSVDGIDWRSDGVLGLASGGLIEIADTQ